MYFSILSDDSQGNFKKMKFKKFEI